MTWENVRNLRRVSDACTTPQETMNGLGRSGCVNTHMPRPDSTFIHRREPHCHVAH